MPHTTSKSTNWAALLQREMKKEIREPTGPGWSTFEEIRTGLGMGRCQLQLRMKRMIDAGEVEKFDGLRLEESRLIRAVWYRETK